MIIADKINNPYGRQVRIIFLTPTEAGLLKTPSFLSVFMQKRTSVPDVTKNTTEKTRLNKNNELPDSLFPLKGAATEASFFTTSSKKIKVKRQLSQIKSKIMMIRISAEKIIIAFNAGEDFIFSRASLKALRISGEDLFSAASSADLAAGGALS